MKERKTERIKERTKEKENKERKKERKNKKEESLLICTVLISEHKTWNIGVLAFSSLK